MRGSSAAEVAERVLSQPSLSGLQVRRSSHVHIILLLANFYPYRNAVHDLFFFKSRDPLLAQYFVNAMERLLQITML